MATVIAVANQKGGVGKTTTSVNIAASLVALKQSVLLIDSDPQGNATMGSGINKNDLPASINSLLLATAPINRVIVNTEAGYDLIPANADLTEAEINLLKLDDRERRLHRALLEVAEQYQWIIIDCPPSLNMLTVNSLVASHEVIVPMQCEYYALEGLASLTNTINDIAQHFNPELHLGGIVRTMYDPRNRLTAEVSEQLFEHFPNQVFKTAIPRNVRLAEAPSYGLPALLYDPKSPGSVAYKMLAKEILERAKKVKKEKKRLKKNEQAVCA